jgi:uncharacterized protein with PIN domain
MTWECAYCGDEEKANNRMPVCHHCGRPVCQLHREMIPDDAFSSGSSASRIAVHCGDCRREYHPQTLNVEPGETSVQEATAP